VAQRVLLVALGAADGGDERRGAVRVAVRGVRVHVHVAVVVVVVVSVRRRGGGGRLLLLLVPDGGRLGGGGAVLEMDAREVARGDGVDDERADGADHGPEPGKREVLPRPAFGEAVGGELLEGVGEDVDEPGGEDDARRERLDEEEDVPVGAQRGDAAAQHGQAAPQRAAHQDGEERRDLERLGARAVARLHRLAAGTARVAAVGGGGARDEQEQQGEDEHCA